MYNGMPVCTTKQLAEVYGTAESRIIQNFNRNQSRFSAGRHYFYLEGEKLRAFRNLYMSFSDVQISSKVRSLYLWTERGANRHCKILDTDKAWEQFDNLEEAYFQVKEGGMPSGVLTGSMETTGIPLLDWINRVYEGKE